MESKWLSTIFLNTQYSSVHVPKAHTSSEEFKYLNLIPNHPGHFDQFIWFWFLFLQGEQLQCYSPWQGYQAAIIKQTQISSGQRKQSPQGTSCFTGLLTALLTLVPCSWPVFYLCAYWCPTDYLFCANVYLHCSHYWISARVAVWLGWQWLWKKEEGWEGLQFCLLVEVEAGLGPLIQTHEAWLLLLSLSSCSV